MVMPPTAPTEIIALCSFSGGKDSCLALWRAQQQGLDVRTLLVMFEESGERSRSHAIPLPVIQRQAQALRKELVVGRASWKGYESAFVDALRGLRSTGHTVAVFGDIDLQAHRDWEEKVCATASVRPYLPLWHQDRRALAQEILDAGFKAIVVCVDSRFLSDDFCGRNYDAAFIRDLPAGVDACGENGEFHTLVYDGPCFHEPVRFALERLESYVAPVEFGATRYCFARLSAA
jgi:uncharacterized protein (TIGR00290 family)